MFSTGYRIGEIVANSVKDVSSNVTNVPQIIGEANKLSETIVYQLRTVEQITERNATFCQESSAAIEELLATVEEISSSSATLAGFAEEFQITIYQILRYNSRKQAKTVVICIQIVRILLLKNGKRQLPSIVFFAFI